MKKLGPNVAAIVLAAGKGKRMNSRGRNKVVCEMAGKPMIVWTVENLISAGVGQIVVVVGYASGSVKRALGGRVDYALQREQMGTGHATRVGLEQVKKSIEDVLVLYGDHSAFYSPKFYRSLVETHRQDDRAMTLVTIVKNNPEELAWGRVVRGRDGNVLGIIEDRDCTPKERQITELNAGAYVFQKSVLERFLPRLKKHENGEYYLPEVVSECLKAGMKVGAVVGDELEVGVGVNTPDQFDWAKKLFEAKVARKGVKKGEKR